MTSFFRFLIVLAACGLTAEAARADMIVSLQATNYTQATGVWANTGTGGNFTVTGGIVANAPISETVAGATAVTFSGVAGCSLETAPASSSVTGGNAWSVEAWVYNPSIGTEEDYFQWSARNSGASRAADLCYGSSSSSGAYVHWANDAGFTGGAPEASKWHYITLTYSGTDNGGVESLYVDGVLNSTTTRTLNLSGQINMILGSGYAIDSGWQCPASLSIGALRLQTGVLDATTVASTYTTEGATYGVVPEPSTLALLAGGLFGLLAYAWRRRK
jgi:hypothetical protein